ncbi:MAG: Glutamate 5-kinase [Alphaproteobacteria bacterium MarineAlpha5_Bin6]|nr:MAG: Glutamate 5-kinase [Alphaproteobacteria bacterium MarineAlpha5_Bin7]PPR53756.1 MAG: Glutamate 5-kinase [Alphaproteobacteria bacterium MarineAlpha5_Bin6]|tara:strand:+ start:64 stop:1173 length:1110 start_codon:yes stop_codon:yes gene_type:complete
MINNYKKIVIKIGSSSIIDDQTGRIRTAWLNSICKNISLLIKENKKIVIVSSGAIALGRKHIGNNKNIRKLEDKQAAAAIGQIELAYYWQQSLKKYKIKCAQLLLTLDDSEIRRRYLNARKTIYSLQKNKIIPVINENDTVATEEIRYGDNDRLAARVAQMIDADLLIMLSDVDGLYTKRPQKNNKVKKISNVKKINPSIEKMASSKSSKFGSGGMATKIWAAKICMNSGCSTIIANGKKNNPLQNIDSSNSTLFQASTSPGNSRKKWILNHLHPSGIIVVDNGAEKAILQNKSLLPSGVTDIKGNFARGDILSIVNEKNSKIGIGVIAYDFSEAKKIIGKKSKEIKIILGYEGRDEIIHKDDLVKINS